MPHPSQAPPSPRAPRHVPPPAPPRGATSSYWADTCRTPRRHPFSSRGGVAAIYRANGSSNTSSAAAAAATIELGHVRSSYLTSQDTLHATGGSHSSGSVLGLHKSFLAELCSYPSFLGHPQTGGVGSNDCNPAHCHSASLLCLLRSLGQDRVVPSTLLFFCSPPAGAACSPPAGAACRASVHPCSRHKHRTNQPYTHAHKYNACWFLGTRFRVRYRPPVRWSEITSNTAIWSWAFNALPVHAHRAWSCAAV